MVLLYFGYMLKANVFITTEQSLHRVEGFSAPHPTPPRRRLGGNKELRGDTGGTADPN